MSRTKTVFLWIFAIFYIASGINHFRDPEFYVNLMPPYLPFPAFLVYASGVIEIVLGAMVLVERLRILAAWAVFAMLVAFMPVHVHMLLNPEMYPDVPYALLWLRLPLQGVFMAWAYWFTRPGTNADNDENAVSLIG